jgi:hypothetical protein
MTCTGDGTNSKGLQPGHDRRAAKRAAVQTKVSPSAWRVLGMPIVQLRV